MCGIIGYLGFRPLGKMLYSGLKGLEYRGYDSAGVAIIEGGAMRVLKDTGKVDELNSSLKFESLAGSVGIAHTRWATHGGVTQPNSHPHVSCNSLVAVVHNGIIENYLELRERLKHDGHVFSSQTDTEVIPHLIEGGLRGGLDFDKAVLAACTLLKGSFAFLAISSGHPREIAAVRNESPLIIGVGDGEFFASSDSLPFLDFTKKAVFLNDGEAAFLKADGNFEMGFFDFKSGRQIVKEISDVKWNATQAQKGEFEHFMLKEIMEEPYVFKQSAFQDEVVLKDFAKEVLDAKEVFVVASGTSFHASLVGMHWFKKIAGKDLRVVLASEFGIEAEGLSKDSLLIAVSQSGETMDVMDCVRRAKEKGARVFSIVNVVGSTLDRMSEKSLYLNCGPEVGVAATKSFLNQLGVFLVLASAAKGLDVDFAKLGVLIGQSLEWNKEKVKEIAKDFKFREHVYFLGRASNYAIALEGALKLKEISYIHAEGMASGELKHGTLALIEKGTPVILLNPADGSFTDSLNNGIEAKARGAKLIALSSGDNENYDALLKIPVCSQEFFYPIVEAVPLQLLAYYAAVERGRNPDKPRNLAKSVTVR